jgi:hypothetical protein
MAAINRIDIIRAPKRNFAIMTEGCEYLQPGWWQIYKVRTSRAYEREDQPVLRSGDRRAKKGP